MMWTIAILALNVDNVEEPFGEVEMRGALQ